MKKIRIVIQAIPFCFGPGAQTLAIGNQLRSILKNNLELIALGTGTTYEFLKKSKTFDEIIEYSSERNMPKKIKSLLLSADKIICVGDFEFIDLVNKIGRKVEFVDPLFWMWGKFPSKINLCNKYYAVDFPGVKKRVREYSKKFPKNLKPVIVNQICEYSKRKKKKHYDIIVVQFGGVQNPFGVNIELIIAMVEEISNSIKNIPDVKKVFVRGSSKVMKIIKKRARALDKRMEIGSSFHKDFLKELSLCKAVLTVPGMSIVYEAFEGKIPIMFILPLNYSQHRQSFAYKKIFKDFDYISFDKFKGYRTLPKNIPEDKAISEAINMGRHFYDDSKARKKFREKITIFLSKKKFKVMKVKKQKIKINGAQQIAEDLVRQIHLPKRL